MRDKERRHQGAVPRHVAKPIGGQIPPEAAHSIGRVPSIRIADREDRVQAESRHRGATGQWGGWPRLRPTGPSWAAANSILSDGSELVRIRSRQEPLSQLAELLITPDDFPVVDKTGLPGKYDFTLEYTTGLPNASIDGASVPSGAPFVFKALQDQLGLQLVHKKLPFDVLIIDEVEEMPTDNKSIMPAYSSTTDI